MRNLPQRKGIEMSKHTPGPWTCDSIDGRFPEHRPDGDIYIREAGAPKPFGLLFGRSDKREMITVRETEQNMARARLIAAAPEMAKILTAVFIDKEHINLWSITARTLLVRIEGEK